MAKKFGFGNNVLYQSVSDPLRYQDGSEGVGLVLVSNANGDMAFSSSSGALGAASTGIDNIARWDSETGALLDDSTWALDDNGQLVIDEYSVNSSFQVLSAYNTNTGTSAGVRMWLGNANSIASAASVQCFGTAWTTAGGWKQDAALFQAGSALAGGLSIIADGASANVAIYAGGHATGDQVAFFEAGGNVGIGTATPGVLEDISDDLIDRVLHVYNSGGPARIALEGTLASVIFIDTDFVTDKNIFLHAWSGGKMEYKSIADDFDPSVTPTNFITLDLNGTPPLIMHQITNFTDSVGMNQTVPGDPTTSAISTFAANNILHMYHATKVALIVESALPSHVFIDTDSSADQRVVQVLLTGNVFSWQVFNDALSSQRTPMQFDTGTGDVTFSGDGTFSGTGVSSFAGNLGLNQAVPGDPDQSLISTFNGNIIFHMFHGTKAQVIIESLAAEFILIDTGGTADSRVLQTSLGVVADTYLWRVLKDDLTVARTPLSLDMVTGDMTLSADLDIAGDFTATGTGTHTFSGAVRVGAGTPEFKLFIESSAAVISCEETQDMHFETAATKRYTITGAGLHGFGTTTPDELVHLALDGVDDASGTFSQLCISGTTDLTKRLNIGYDTTGNHAFIQVLDVSTAYLPLEFLGQSFTMKQATSTAAVPVLILNQTDIDDTFINFIGTSAADGTRSISSDTTEDAAKTAAVRCEINGTLGWLRIYAGES